MQEEALGLFQCLQTKSREMLSIVTMFFYTKNKKTLLLWITSPLIWFVGIEITPMLPLAFFFLLSYILFKKWENDGKKSSVMLSGFFLGFSLALWTGALILVLVFMLIFF